MMDKSLLELYQAGGVIIDVLLFLSVLTCCFFLYCVILLRRRRLFPEKLVSLARNCKGTTRAAAIKQCEGDHHPFAQILLPILTSRNCSAEQTEALLTRVALKVEPVLNRGVNGLEVIGAIAPMLGLLGTVIGMYDVFARISEAGAAGNMDILSGGIAEALLTTIGGLVVGIPAFVAAHFYALRAENYLVEMETLALELDNHLREDQCD